MVEYRVICVEKVKSKMTQKLWIKKDFICDLDRGAEQRVCLFDVRSTNDYPNRSRLAAARARRSRQ